MPPHVLGLVRMAPADNGCGDSDQPNNSARPPLPLAARSGRHESLPVPIGSGSVVGPTVGGLGTLPVVMVNGVGRVPTATEEARFWGLVESAWAACGLESGRVRQGLVARDPAADDDTGDLYVLDGWLDQFLTQLRGLCDGLSSAGLTDLDRVVERKLYDLDRREIHEHTDGSDDGFLYCRGFIIAVGHDFYDAVDGNPAMAVMDAECEAMCYFFAHLHEERFGDFPKTNSGISRESHGNPDGW